MIQGATEDVQTSRGEAQTAIRGSIDPAESGHVKQPVQSDTGLCVCPLCACSTTDRNEIYVHLMTNHRKSRISEVLLSKLCTDRGCTD